jgi:hypothetical protein
MAPLERAQMSAPDAALIRREFAFAAQMLRHGARRVLFQVGEGNKRDLAADLAAIETTYRDLWRARSRPGGLDDSAARLTQAREMYTD